MNNEKQPVLKFVCAHCQKENALFYDEHPLDDLWDDRFAILLNSARMKHRPDSRGGKRLLCEDCTPLYDSGVNAAVEQVAATRDRFVSPKQCDETGE